MPSTVQKADPKDLEIALAVANARIETLRIEIASLKQQLAVANTRIEVLRKLVKNRDNVIREIKRVANSLVLDII